MSLKIKIKHRRMYYTENIYLILHFKKSWKDWTPAQMTRQTPLSVKTRYYKLDYCRVIVWGREEALTHENVMLYSSNNHTTSPPPPSPPHPGDDLTFCSAICEPIIKGTINIRHLSSSFGKGVQYLVYSAVHVNENIMYIMSLLCRHVLYKGFLQQNRDCTSFVSVKCKGLGHKIESK